MEPPARKSAADAKSIAVIGLSYPFRGGISHYTTLLVRELRKRRPVRFISLLRQYPGFLFPGKSQYDYSARKLEESNERLVDTLNPLTWLKVARMLRRERPALIIFQWWHPFFAPAFGTIVRLLPRDLQRRVCFLCHNVLPHEGSSVSRLLTKFAFGRARFFIVHSEQDQKHLLELKPDATVCKGVHPSYEEFGSWDGESKADARAALAIPEDQRTILFFGLIRTYKGLDYLIEAMPAVLRKFGCQLLIVGEFYDDKQKYLDLLDRLGIGSSVRVVDRYVPNEEVARYFRAADVAVLPYVSATQSGIVQIAFGLGTPVITTDVGGLPEAVAHERTGLIVKPRDASQLADAIVRYYENGLEDPFRKEILGQAGRFEWDSEIGIVEGFLAAGPEPLVDRAPPVSP
ncbi:MAG: glycosyltransferase [Gammaproteobacteria bacterium]